MEIYLQQIAEWYANLSWENKYCLGLILGLPLLAIFGRMLGWLIEKIPDKNIF